MTKLIKPSDLRTEAQRLLKTGDMPDLDTLLKVVADARQKYSPFLKVVRRLENPDDTGEP